MPVFLADSTTLMISYICQAAAVHVVPSRLKFTAVETLVLTGIVIILCSIAALIYPVQIPAVISVSATSQTAMSPASIAQKIEVYGSTNVVDFTAPAFGSDSFSSNILVIVINAAVFSHFPAFTR